MGICFIVFSGDPLALQKDPSLVGPDKAQDLADGGGLSRTVGYALLRTTTLLKNTMSLTVASSFKMIALMYVRQKVRLFSFVSALYSSFQSFLSNCSYLDKSRFSMGFMALSAPFMRSARRSYVLLYTKKTDAYASYSNALRTVFLNPVVKQKSAIKKMAEDAMGQFKPGAWSTGNAFHSVYHELGHAVQHMILDNDPAKRIKIDVLYNKAFSDILGSETVWTAEETVARQLAAKAKGANFSYYGLCSSNEFVAESIAQFLLSDNPSDIANNVIKILTGGK